MRKETSVFRSKSIDDIGYLELSACAFTTSGVAYPSDLALLKSVYDRVCKEQCLPEGCPEAAELSEVAMQLFSRGIVDEGMLYRELRRA